MELDSRQEEDRGMSILLRYQGPAVDDGTMNVYDAAANMVAFSDYVVAAAHKLYGDDVVVKAEINAFQRGSFVTDILFQVAGIGSTLLSITTDVKGVVNTVKQSLELFKFLKGSPPAKIEKRDDHSINVTNNNGNIIVVTTESLHLTLDPLAGKAASQFIGEALAKQGVNQIEISSNGESVAQATKDDAQYYRPIADDTPLLEQTVRMGLTIEMPSFKDGKKWRMWDGEASVTAAMEDENFIGRVNNGEPFRKGDVLICDVRFTQTNTAGVLKIQRAIIRVHDHKAGPEQTNLLGVEH